MTKQGVAALVAVALMAVAPLAQAQELKIGVVNSDRILREWTRATAKLGPLAQAQAEAEAALFRAAFPRGQVREQTTIESRLLLPDPNDVHVLAVAIAGHADCIVKAALAGNPFTRGPIRAAGFIANSRGEGLLQDCLRSLASGNNLIIFPEGTRTPLHGKVRLQRGAAHVAVRGRIDITPVHIHCSLPMLTKGAPWWQVPPRKPHFFIEVRDDIGIEAFCQGAASDSVAARHVTDHLSAQLFKEPSRA